MEHIVPKGYIHFVEEEYNTKYREEREGAYTVGRADEVIQEAPFVISGYDSLWLEAVVNGTKTFQVSYVYRIKTQVVDSVSYFRCKKTVSIGPNDAPVDTFDGEDYLTLLIDNVLRRKIQPISPMNILSSFPKEIDLLKDPEERTTYQRLAREIGAEVLEVTALIVDIQDITNEKEKN